MRSGPSEMIFGSEWDTHHSYFSEETVAARAEWYFPVVSPVPGAP
jgi:hypothetical protein